MSRVEREAPEVGAMVRRMVRALVRRAAAGDTLALEELAALEDLLPTAVTVAGHLMRGEGRYSWTDVAEVTGTSRQAAHKRHSVLPATPDAAWLTGGGT